VDTTRSTLWAGIATAVADGCPVPVSTYVSRDGACASVRVQTRAEVQVWAEFLGMPEPTTRIYPTEDGKGQITTETETAGVPWLTVECIDIVLMCVDEVQQWLADPPDQTAPGFGDLISRILRQSRQG
jgi:hypothetical protein